MKGCSLRAVDADIITPEAVADLSARVNEVIHDDNVVHLYDQDFVPYAAMVEVRDPLKYEVRNSSGYSAMTSSMLAICSISVAVRMCIGPILPVHKLRT